MAQHNPYIDLQITFVYTITFDIFFKIHVQQRERTFLFKTDLFFLF
jgi:hypothetical protein